MQANHLNATAKQVLFGHGGPRLAVLGGGCRHFDRQRLAICVLADATIARLCAFRQRPTGFF